MTPSNSTTDPAVTRKRFIAVALIALIGVFIYVVSSVLLGVIGGFILWAMSRGLYERLLKFTRGRTSLAALLAVLTLLVLVVAPIATVLSLMVNDAVNLTEKGIAFFDQMKPQIERFVERFTSGETPSVFGYQFDPAVLMDKLEEFSGTAAQYLVEAMQRTAGGIASAMLQIFVMLYTLFFCYTDGHRFFEWLKRILPLDPHETDKLFHNFFNTSITSLKALGIIGTVQGILGGLGMWICGIPSPFFFTVLLIFSTVIPVVGAQIILIPASLFLMLTGEVWWGVGLLLWGTVAIANVDNLLRPYLVGRAVELHELIVFLTTIGGIAVFGFWGFLVGPVIAGLLKAVAEFYIESNAPPVANSE